MLDDTPSPDNASPDNASPANPEPADATAASPPEPLAKPRRRRRAAVREPGPPAPVAAAESPAADSRPAEADASAVDRFEAEASPPAEPEVRKPARRRVAKAKASPPEPEESIERSSDRPEPSGSDSPAADTASGAAPRDAVAGPPAGLAATAGPPADPTFTPPAFVAPAFIAPRLGALTETTGPGSAGKPATDAAESDLDYPDTDTDTESETEQGTRRRRRGRRGRGRNRADGDDPDATATDDAATGVEPGAEEDPDAAKADPSSEPSKPSAASDAAGNDEDTVAGKRRRRRRRRTAGEGDEPGADGTGDAQDVVPTVVHVRAPRQSAKRARGEDEVQGVKGSTRLEAKRQRRRDGRDNGRKRPSIISESEFLARREAVERVMVVREGADRTQIGVLEDDVLVEHYVTRASASSFVGNVYLGRVQNVLPSMEAAFVDIGKSRNAVLYAGEVNYDASQFEGKPHRIEQALKSGDKVLVQVSKDPIGSKGSRLTSQISLPGRYVVYIPEGERTGISRKLPDTERARLKSILKRVAPQDAGLIVRTAAEGASEDELARDMARLVAQWDAIGRKAGAASPPTLLHAEPDLVIRVIRDVFNEDFAKMIVQGDKEWETIQGYVDQVAPDLQERLERWTAERDVFAAYRVDEQLAKALDRKVWLPSGGYLIFDRTEAMVVVDVNTGRFIGKGGNLEETVTRNNLEAAEELARQLRLRDLGGMIVIDFIDMVLEANRDLVLRRLMECLGRDRTRHQVSEVTSLGLVQMTRKRVGQGLQDLFAQVCPECNGRGIKEIINPFEPAERLGSPDVPKPAPPRHAPGTVQPVASPEPVADPSEPEPADSSRSEPEPSEPEASEPEPSDPGRSELEPVVSEPAVETLSSADALG